MQNMFRTTSWNGEDVMDKQYLRTCAVYKIYVRQRRISKERAVELIAERGLKEDDALRLVEIWQRHVDKPELLEPLGG